MTTVLTINNDFKRKMNIIYRPRVTVKLCSIGKEPFDCDIEIQYVPDTKILEFESFDKYLLEEIAPLETTIEAVSQILYDKLYNLLKPEFLHVEVNATTKVHYPASVVIMGN